MKKHPWLWQNCCDSRSLTGIVRLLFPCWRLITDNRARLLVFLFRFLRNETVLFSVQGRTIYIMICNNPIRVKFVIVNVNTVEIRSSQQNVALRTFQLLLYSKMRNYACNSRFSILKYPSKLQVYWTFIRIVIMKRNFTLEVERPPCRRRILADETSSFCLVQRRSGAVFWFRVIYWRNEYECYQPVTLAIHKVNMLKLNNSE